MNLAAQLFGNKPNPDFVKPELQKTYWKKLIDAADKYNHPGKFTALVGYEWTSAPLRAGRQRADKTCTAVSFSGETKSLKFHFLLLTAPIRKISGPIWKMRVRQAMM